MHRGEGGEANQQPMAARRADAIGNKLPINLDNAHPVIVAQGFFDQAKSGVRVDAKTGDGVLATHPARTRRIGKL